MTAAASVSVRGRATAEDASGRPNRCAGPCRPRCKRFSDGHDQHLHRVRQDCEHCVAAVAEEVSRLAGVQQVIVNLVAGGQSTVTVTSDAPLAWDAVRAAVDEAGYILTGVAG